MAVDQESLVHRFVLILGDGQLGFDLLLADQEVSTTSNVLSILCAVLSRCNTIGRRKGDGTQNQALWAVLYDYQKVLGKDMQFINRLCAKELAPAVDLRVGDGDR